MASTYADWTTLTEGRIQAGRAASGARCWVQQRWGLGIAVACRRSPSWFVCVSGRGSTARHRPSGLCADLRWAFCLGVVCWKRLHGCQGRLVARGAVRLTSRTTDSSEDAVDEDADDGDRWVCRRRAVRAAARCSRALFRLRCRMWTQTTMATTPRITNTAERARSAWVC